MNTLFVCHGNLERSAAAEILARRLYPDWPVASCGVAATPGRITAKKMRIALSQRGYPTQGIRSTLISQQQVDWADRIFIMDGGNERRFKAQFHSLDRVQRLSDYVNHANTVPNPGRCPDLTLHLRIVDMILEALPRINQERNTASAEVAQQGPAATCVA